MDTTEPVVYRGVQINTLTLPAFPENGVTDGVSGTAIDEVDMSQLDVDQATERKALAEGLDVGEAFLGGRLVRMRGTTYGKSRRDLYDQLHILRRTFNAKHAFLADEAAQGFLPMTFFEPTDDTETYGETGLIALRVVVAPRNFGRTINRDRAGGKTGDPLAISWRVNLLAKDPMIYGASDVSVDITNSVMGTWENRGDFPTPIRVRFVATAAAGSVTVIAGDRVTVITVPAGVSGRVFEYRDKLLKVDGVHAANLLTLDDDTHATIPVGTSTYSVTRTAAAPSGTNTLSFSEAYA